MTNPEQNPQEGGSYLRLPDGSLQKIDDNAAVAPEVTSAVASPTDSANAAKKAKE